MRVLAHATVCGLLTMTACGASGDSKLKLAVSDAVYSINTEDQFPFEISRTEADCVADTLLDDISNAKDLQGAYDNGKDARDLLDAIGDDTAAVEALVGCKSRGDLLDALINEFKSSTNEGVLSEEAASCVKQILQGYSAANLRDLFIGLSDTGVATEAFEDFKVVLERCVAGLSTT